MPRLYGGEVTTRSTCSSRSRDIPLTQSSRRRSNLVINRECAVISYFVQRESGAHLRLRIDTRTFGLIRLLSANGGQALKTEDRGSRVHFAPARWHGKICVERADARRADRQRN